MTAHRREDNRIPELDGLRVLLVFIVSWYHIWQQSWLTPVIGSVSLDFLLRTGYMMVDGTILLSAFLLFLPYAKSMRHGSPIPEVRDFYQKRVMRIMPSYYFLLAVAFFLMALPFGLYHSRQFMAKDLLAHLTFTFTFSYDTYVSTPLGAAPWTLAIELQAYLIFPFLARLVMKKPRIVIPAMIAVAFGWRGYHIFTLTDYNMVVNQLPSFMDIYAVGMLAAMAYVRLCECKSECEWTGRKHIAVQLASTALAALCVWGIVALLRVQASAGGQNGIQWGQMVRRFPFTLLLCGVLVSLPFTVRPLRFLMGNRVMKFLSAISMNYYLIHQTLIVHMRRLGVPYSEHVYPNQMGDRPWQYKYTFLSFALSFLAAVLVTLLVERPAARWLKKRFAARNAARKTPAEDPRMAKLAHTLVHDACRLQPGEKIWLQGNDAPPTFMAMLVDEVSRAGGIPYVKLQQGAVDRALAMAATREQLTWLAEDDEKRMSECQAYVGVTAGGMNALRSVPDDNLALVSACYTTPIYAQTRVRSTRFVDITWPTPAMAKAAGMRPDAFEKYFFDVCGMDYASLTPAMEALADRLEKAQQVRITGPGTDLTFSVRAMRAIVCAGECSIPDGEVYTVPYAGTLEGTITFNMPLEANGFTFENVRLTFREGRVVEASANDTDRLNAILDTDPGARAAGEFALGVNPHITRPIGDPAFDEKLAGSFHLALGRACPDCDNGNRSAVRLDLICLQTAQMGGGEILLDGELLRKDGLFVPEELKMLNPDKVR